MSGLGWDQRQELVPTFSPLSCATGWEHWEGDEGEIMTLATCLQ